MKSTRAMIGLLGMTALIVAPPVPPAPPARRPARLRSLPGRPKSTYDPELDSRLHRSIKEAFPANGRPASHEPKHPKKKQTAKRSRRINRRNR
jgi:hypothetical protein